MSKYYCNPININYRYQFYRNPRIGKLQISREAADPTILCFKGKYYIFASMTLGVWVSEDLVDWKNKRLPDNLPLYDYAPDARIVGDYIYLCASKRSEACNFYRTKDVENGPYEEVKGTFPFWDPNIFTDDDGRVYLYWGCTNIDPIWGVELDPLTMLPIGEKVGLLSGDSTKKGYERPGENNSISLASQEEIETGFQKFLKDHKITEDQLSPQHIRRFRGMFSNKPYIEGAYVNKYNGRYYLQYAFGGTQYNTYGDGVYVSNQPLGPYILADNNPFSYHPNGFLPGAGHGSTMKDLHGNLWHTATMRISMNHLFERRVGIWPAGFDKNGELFCNQEYGDWPHEIKQEKMDPFAGPSFMLLSYNKKAEASSISAPTMLMDGKLHDHNPYMVTDENVQTWWRAASAAPGEWITVDLGNAYDVHAVQVNFADDYIEMDVPGENRGENLDRYIDEIDRVTRWTLEGSLDKENFFMIEDLSKAELDLTHNLIVREKGVRVRYLRITSIETALGEPVAISGIRVFGHVDGETPAIPIYETERTTPLDMLIKITDPEGNTPKAAIGYNILWGSSPDKLYHSFLTYTPEVRVGALVEEKSYYVRVDAFNESGITKGTVQIL